jgi:hypothetical protein
MRLGGTKPGRGKIPATTDCKLFRQFSSGAAAGVVQPGYVTHLQGRQLDPGPPGLLSGRPF